jgi:hypothetical protein
MDMASSSKKKTTMAKLARERRLVERRLDKKAKKEARKYAALHPSEGDSAPMTTDGSLEPSAEPAGADGAAPAHSEA